MKTQDILNYLSKRDGKVTTLKNLTDRFSVKGEEMKAKLADMEAQGIITDLGDFRNAKSKDTLDLLINEVQAEMAQAVEDGTMLSLKMEESEDLLDTDAETYEPEVEEEDDAEIAEYYAELDAEDAADQAERDAEYDRLYAASVFNDDGTDDEQAGEIEIAGEPVECMICGKGLTVEKSLERGIGPVCWDRLFGFLGGKYTMQELKDETVVGDTELSDLVEGMKIEQVGTIKHYENEEAALMDFPEGIVSLSSLVATAGKLGVGVSTIMKQAGENRQLLPLRNENWRYFFINRARFVSAKAELDLPEIVAEKTVKKAPKVKPAKVVKVKAEKVAKVKKERKVKKGEGLTIIPDPSELAPDVAEQGYDEEEVTELDLG